VFAEAWLPSRHGWRDLHDAMKRSLESAERVEDLEISIADMEEIETAPEEVAQYHRELAYDTGAWAVAFMIHESATQRVSSLRDDFYPSVNELGWEVALAQFVGMPSKEEFYAAFAAFMDLPVTQQLGLLDRLRD